MNLITISNVSKNFNISTRTLRYYEKIGLLTSQKKEDYAYRTYDEASVRRLQKIIVLRKLRIPLKQIHLILNNDDLTCLVKVFQDNIKELDGEIFALNTIRSILQTFLSDLTKNSEINIKFDLLDDNQLIKVIESLTLSRINFKEERSMEELDKAIETLDKLKNVRILYLPPATVASSQFIGENPEDIAGERLEDFVRKTNLHIVKPDLRVYGFNNPCPQDNGEAYGYEFWVTIPDDMSVPKPLIKRHFKGGLYATHCIKMGDFHEWKIFHEWLCNNSDYDIDSREPLGMGGCIEEHLNAFTYYQLNKEKAQFKQVDLLIPIKQKINFE